LERLRWHNDREEYWHDEDEEEPDDRLKNVGRKLHKPPDSNEEFVKSIDAFHPEEYEICNEPERVVDCEGCCRKNEKCYEVHN
jgi:hypothetical protein